ncbi:MAG TPA: hypothetical protein VLT33_19140 [Labilithrix sp.]|nr:hypothetical protein [Labilithrix sp.]
MRLATAASVVTTVLVLSLVTAREAHARETGALDEEDESDEGASANEAVEQEAFGPRSNLRTRAEEVSFDPRLRTLELAGNVRVDAPPFHLRSQRIKLTRTRLGIEIVGKGSLAFCPCLGTPLTVDFEEAIVAPPGDLILKNPTLRLYSVPVLPLPYFWLRGDEKLGLLPPDLAYRGDDGLYAGGGVHVPWKSRGEKNALDLRGGAYVLRGFVADARLRTPSSTTKIRYDRLPSAIGDDGLLVDARGATSRGELGASWDADVLRGRRGVVSTTELDAAARPWDRAAIEGALRGGPFVVATAMRAVTRRGGGLADVDAAGPIASVRASGSAGSVLTYDATIEGGSLRFTNASTSRDALSFLRAELGTRAVYLLGPVETSLALRGAGDVAAEARDRGDDRAGSARARVAVPLVRRLDRESDPWQHLVEPFAEVAVLHAKGDGLLGLSPARAAFAIDGTAPLADAGFTTTLGRWGTREALELGGAMGAAFGSRRVASGTRPLARARLAASLAWLGASADAADVLGGGEGGATSNGFAVVARARIGPNDGVRVLANLATRDGLDPVLARALFDAPLEPAAGFLALDGTTGGAGLVIPWSRIVTTSLGADGDATHRELVAARAGVELRDRCGCLTLRVLGSHRLAREGVDVWLALDFAADR